MYKLAFVLFCLVAAVGQLEAGEHLDKAADGIKNAAGKTVDGVKNVAGKTVDGVKNVAGKTVEGVKNAADGLKVKVEKIESKPVVQDFNQGLLGSFIHGAASLVRNVTSEAGKYVSSIAHGAANLGKHTGGAVVNQVKDGARRIKHGRNGAATTEASVESEAPSANDADAPAELNNAEAAATEAATETATEAAAAAEAEAAPEAEKEAEAAPEAEKEAEQ